MGVGNGGREDFFCFCFCFCFCFERELLLTKETETFCVMFKEGPFSQNGKTPLGGDRPHSQWLCPQQGAEKGSEFESLLFSPEREGCWER